MTRRIFINLPVKDLNKSKKFFTGLGFSFNPQFTDEKAACLVIGENIFAMLLAEPFFKSFSGRKITNTAKSSEVMLAIDADSREKVDEMVRKAVDSGGSVYNPPENHGWMYGHSFTDPDGHQWEVMHIDEKAMPGEDP